MGLFLVGIAVFTTGVVVGVSLGDTPDDFGLELAKALLTLGSGLVLGGAVKLMLDMFQDAAREKEEQHLRLERLLADLRDVHDSAERARLLISAHRSAKTYGEQMRALIDAQVLLLKVKRTLDVSGRARDTFTDWLAHMIAYLAVLHQEYREHYKSVSDCQRYDEKVTDLRIRTLAEKEVAGTAHGPLDDELTSLRGWAMLEQLPVLTDLINRGPQYQERFFAPFHELASGLVLPAPGPAGQPLSEPEFEQRVADISAEILALCVKACVIVMPPDEAVVEA